MNGDAPAPAVRRGALRIYLGAAPGVGKTFAMLNEGGRRSRRGTDVVVGVVETHGREHTLAQVADLEVLPRRMVEHRGASLTEMDIDALLARAPDVALVDELAHTNAPGSRNEKRWEDIEELLDAGIDVISTVNIQHLESVNDVVEEITGITQRETVPDAWVRAADQIELVDMTPEALRRRMAHGNIYPAERIDAALGNYFRIGNLGALRELALLWVADRVDESLTEYRERHGIDRTWETRERVVVAITGAPSGDDLIRRAARIATRARAELIGVHVRADDGVRGPSLELLGRHRELLAELGGRYLEVPSGDVAAALVHTARAQNATQIVLGASKRSRWAELTNGSVINRVLRASGTIDVHVISTTETDEERSLWLPTRPRRVNLPPRRRMAGWVLALAAPLALTAALAPFRDGIELTSILLLYVLVVIATAATGGAGPALVAAVVCSLAANWYFFPPVHTWTISERENVVALVVFLVIAAVVSAFVSAVARRSADAARARAEAETLALAAGSTASADPLGTLTQHFQDVFGLDAASVLQRRGDSWTVVAAAGDPPLTSTDEADEVIPIDDVTAIAVAGAAIPAEDRGIVRAFASMVAAAVEGRRLTQEAAAAGELAEADKLRTALLAAVSHDLRTPLASIKASATSLLADDVDWPPEAIKEFSTAIVEESDRLTTLVDNLLDMSRLTAGAVIVRHTPVGLDEVVPAALDSLGDRARHGTVDVAVPETLPRVDTDPALLERAIANLVDNALAWSTDGQRVRLEAGAVAGHVHLRIVDRGPGIPMADRGRVFMPFQRLGDRSNGAGVGLGLAVARGFVDAIGGELVIEDTPGGGATMVVSLPTAERVTEVRADG